MPEPTPHCADGISSDDAPSDGAARLGPGRVRRTVGRSRERDPLDVLWDLLQRRRAMGFPPTLPTDHVRKHVGRARPR